MKRTLVLVACGGCLGLGEPKPPDCVAPRALAELNSFDLEASPWLSSDRLEIWFSSNRGGNLRLLHAGRENRDERFSDLVDVSDLGVTGSTFDPFLEPDGLTMWFAALGSATGAEPQLYRATRSMRGTARFSPAEPVIGTGEHPSMTADRRTLYFSRRSGATYSVFRTMRDTASDVFGPPEELTEIRGSELAIGDVRDPSISPDGERLLFTYRATGTAPYRVYETDLLGGTFEPGTLESDTGPTDPANSDQDPAFHAGGDTFVFASDRAVENTDLDLYIACE